MSKIIKKYIDGVVLVLDAENNVCIEADDNKLYEMPINKKEFESIQINKNSFNKIEYNGKDCYIGSIDRYKEFKNDCYCNINGWVSESTIQNTVILKTSINDTFTELNYLADNIDIRTIVCDEAMGFNDMIRGCCNLAIWHEEETNTVEVMDYEKLEALRECSSKIDGFLDEVDEYLENGWNDEYLNWDKEQLDFFINNFRKKISSKESLNWLMKLNN